MKRDFAAVLEAALSGFWSYVWATSLFPQSEVPKKAQSTPITDQGSEKPFCLSRFYNFYNRNIASFSVADFTNM